ncbi:molybdate ABC transporter substrate-binding protein [Pectinatus sottacetonis]|uniref:molybdate ABC transporter substrate-binding protein n=1 Tax=Pectinatus sottacetonis TaxID=1002795 RepID=UPI0018C52CC1|nr:molybdate ABC transporter substrate-binding protein [Pectinatus sottacetonis]
MRLGKSFMMAATVILVGMLMFSMAGCGQQISEKKAVQPAKEKIVVSAAASLKDVMGALKKEYVKNNPNVDLTFNLASSGSLQRQIEQGAPADIFISAAQKQMNALEQKKLLADGTRKNLLVNTIVLITPKDNKAGIKKFSDLTTAKVHKIAMGDPKSVPAGQYAQQIFVSLKYLDAVKPKLVYGSDVRAVLTWVENGEADCGLVYKTDAAISDEVKIIAQAPAGTHKPIIYPVAILKSTKNMEAAKKFVDFLQTPEAAKIFEKYGFSPAK